MNILVVKDKQEGGKEAFKIVKEAVESGAKVLGLATGSSPETLYEEMVNSELDFSDMMSINLDEYVGLEADHPQSYHTFMQEHLFSKKPFKKSVVPDGMKDVSETARYEEWIEDHPIDLQILGIGVNGHIGFNEPGTSFSSQTQKVALTDETIESNKRFFESKDDVPRYAYSMGICTILQAKEIVLLAYGKEKAEAVKKAIEDRPTEKVPASALQNHSHVTVILDEDAASLLTHTN